MHTDILPADFSADWFTAHYNEDKQQRFFETTINGVTTDIITTKDPLPKTIIVQTNQKLMYTLNTLTSHEKDLITDSIPSMICYNAMTSTNTTYQLSCDTNLSKKIQKFVIRPLITHQNKLVKQQNNITINGIMLIILFISWITLLTKNICGLKIVKRRNLMKIIKANGIPTDFDSQRIIDAIQKAANRTNDDLSNEQIDKVLSEVNQLIGYYGTRNINLHVDDIHDIVARALAKVRPDVSSEYRNYRAYKNEQNKQAVVLEQELNASVSTTANVWPSVTQQVDSLIKKHPNEHYVTILQRYLNDIQRGGDQSLKALLANNNATNKLVNFIFEKYAEK